MDHFDGSRVLGTGPDDERGGADEPLKMGALCQRHRTGAGDLTADISVNESGAGSDGIEKLDTGSSFHTEVPTSHFSDDFSVTADDEIAAAFDRAGKFAKHGEIVALKGNSGDRAGFLDHHITARLDSAVPIFRDFVI